MIIKKFEVLMQFFQQYRMEVSELKTKLVVANGSQKEKEEFVCMGLVDCDAC